MIPAASRGEPETTPLLKVTMGVSPTAKTLPRREGKMVATTNTREDFMLIFLPSERMRLIKENVFWEGGRSMDTQPRTEIYSRFYFPDKSIQEDGSILRLHITSL
jgi:hypothetical protein